MAKVIQPLGAVQASGTVEGNTHSRWRGLNIVRRKSLPSNPGTPAQGSQRNQLQLAVGAVKTAFTTPATKAAWATWASLNAFTDPFTGNSIFLPPYQAALKVGMARLAFGLDMDLSTIPTISSTPVPLGIEINDGAGVLTYEWDAATFGADDNVQLWTAGPVSAARTPLFANAKLQKVIACTTGAQTTDDIIDSPLPGYYTVFAKVFTDGAPKPSPAKNLGQFLVT